MTREPPRHIVIAGGGVAAIEAVAALRTLLGSLPRITLLAPDTHFVPRPSSVATPFGFGGPTPLPFDAIQRHARFDVHHGLLARVEANDHVAVDGAGRGLRYDKLLVAVGAAPRPWLDGAISFGGPADAAAVESAIAGSGRIAFVLPSPSTWALPVYELAIMAALDLGNRNVEPHITVVTPEPAPLWVFGETAGGAVAQLLAERRIALRVGVRALRVRPGRLELEGAAPVQADRVIALPTLAGPAVPGLPHAAYGFIPVDSYGRVADTPDVFAAGDATTFPFKQGGLAAQQADAACEAIAADLGVAVTPKPFRPVMRGLLLTGGAPLYLRSALSAEGEPESTEARSARRSVASRRALWWPPGKIAGRYLAPLLATARPALATPAELQDFDAGAVGEDRDDARELALMLAEEEAAMHQYSRAVHALDAAAMLTGGVLPDEWAERRERWMKLRREGVNAG
jgi:sulfide:quinone oxidoreductase